MRPLHVVLTVVAAALVAGCAYTEPAAPDRPATAPYAGPMQLPVSHRDRATVAERAGAAARALECDGAPYAGGAGAYDDGLATVQDHPETALVAYLGDAMASDALPGSGYRVERRDDGRVLLSYDVRGRTKVAAITAEGVVDFNGRRGWGVETWAQCDPAELPAAFTDSTGTGVWEDATGTRVPVTRVRSFQGAEHCGWQGVTFLLVGPEEAADWYVRDTTDGDFHGMLRTSFDPSSTLPGGATDTGWRREGRVLWTTRDAAYLVGVDDPGDVERWPAAKDQILCS